MSLETTTVPIFPLPNLVFFPRTVLPLHIFEPRYKEMIADALDGDCLLGIVQLKPGWDKDYYGNPPVYRHLTIGRIVQHRRHEDGRYDIVLEGLSRARLVSETPRGQYRLAQAELLADEVPDGREDSVFTEYSCLRRVFDNFMEALPDTVEPLKPDSWRDPEPGTLADLLAHIFIENAYDKQCVLGETDVERRLKLVSVQIRTILKQKAPQEPPA